MSNGLSIVWDLAIDAGAWPGPLLARQALVGEVWLGPLGLLDRLETELGLGGLHPSAAERAGDLAAKLAAGAGWWRESYEADPIGTCQRLLRDRDTLVLWGWRGEAASERLATLWEATANALPGIPDRLREVRAALGTRRVDIEKITMMSRLASLPPAWAQVFTGLAAAGVTINEVAATSAMSVGDLAAARTASFSPTGDGSLTLFRPHGPLAAADEVAALLAAMPSLDDVLIIGADHVLDAALARHGLPRLGTAGALPASASLIRFVIEAAFEPMDPTALHALLCLDPGPVPRRVASRLIDALGEFPSRRAPDWRKALDEGFEACDEDWRDDVRIRLDALLRPVARRDGTIAASEISQRMQIVAAWARARMTKTPSLAIIARLAEEARRLIAIYGAETLSLVALRRVCDELDSGSGLSIPGQVGLASVASPGSVLAPVGVVIWWGFTRASAPMPTRLRLSSHERESLRASGVDPDFGQLMEGEAARWRRPLEMATRALMLVCPTTSESGERSFPHPLWDELRAVMPRPQDAAAIETRRLQFPVRPSRRAVDARPLPTQVARVETGSSITIRPTESPSSLEKLLGCSMAWALQYHGGLYPGLSAGPGAPTPLLYGKIAHYLLALVFADGALSPDAAEARAKEVVDVELAKLSESLSLPRYQAERTTVAQAVIQTARALGSLMSATGASVRGVEIEIKGALAGFDISGRADLVLAKPDVIVDLKWGRKGPADKLVSGSALQLAVYAEVHRNGGPHPEVAYLTLQRQELLGQQSSRLPGVKSLGTATALDTWAGAVVSLGERRAELAAGVLVAPAAEGAEVESELVGGRLAIEPPCGYCSFTAICGQRGCE